MAKPTRLSQVLAIEKGVKSRSTAKRTNLYHMAQKPVLFSGFYRSYAPKNEGGEVFPSEGKRVEAQTQEAIQEFCEATRELLDVTATKDWSNCAARGNVTVEGKTLIPDAPVTFLLSVEKELIHLRTYLEALPILDAAHNWRKDEGTGLYKADPERTHRTRKVQRALVLYPATEKHPAQTQLVTEDEVDGFWTREEHSGAIPEPEKKAMLERVENLLKAVRFAREEANTTEAQSREVGKALLDYVMKG